MFEIFDFSTVSHAHAYFVIIFIIIIIIITYLFKNRTQFVNKGVGTLEYYSTCQFISVFVLGSGEGHGRE